FRGASTRSAVWNSIERTERFASTTVLVLPPQKGSFWPGPRPYRASRCRHAGTLYVRADKLHDVIHGGARLKDRGHPSFLETLDVLIRNDPAHQHDHVIHFVLPEQIHHARHNRVVGPGQDREPDDLYVFLEGSGDDHFWS